MPTFNTNLRRIRMTETGRWTLQNEKERARAIHLCDFCAINSMCITQQRLATIMTDFEVNAVISECAGYRPHLNFRDEIGLDGSFNTIRLGKAWSERLRVGQEVTLWHSTADREIGVARVVRAFASQWCDLHDDDVISNHTQIGRSANEARPALFEVLRKSYGPHLMKPDRLVSVIYLETCLR